MEGCNGVRHWEVDVVCPVCGHTGDHDDCDRGALASFLAGTKPGRPAPADGDDYMWAPSAGTAQRTGPERTQAQLDDLAFRLRTLEAQHSQEIRKVEHVLDQYTGARR